MATLKIVLSVLFIIVSLVITIVILFQEGKSAGLGTIAGVADTYWGKNKGRSKEGRLVKATIVCVVLFFIISIALNMGNEQTIYMILGIMWFVFDVLYITIFVFTKTK